MTYRITEGMVLECVCGQYVLIATLKARETCPYITKINEDSAYIWKMLEKRTEYAEMQNAIEKEYEITPEEAGETLKVFLRNLQEKGYITAE